MLIHMPIAAEVNELKPGDLAPTPYGRLDRVLEILYRGTDVNGNCFVGYTVPHGGNGRITMSIKEGELTRHVGQHCTAEELRVLESRLRKERGHTKPLLH